MTVDYQKIAEDVAAEMGWRVTRNTYETCFVIGKDDMSLRLLFDGYRNKGKVEVAANYPDRATELYRVERPSINVAYARGAKVIAKEIERRLMPKYLPALRDVQERLRDIVEHESDQLEMGRRIANALGLEEPKQQRYSGRSHVRIRDYGYLGDRSDVEFDVLYGGDVEVSLRFSNPDDAVALAAFLRSLKG